MINVFYDSKEKNRKIRFFFLFSRSSPAFDRTLCNDVALIPREITQGDH